MSANLAKKCRDNGWRVGDCLLVNRASYAFTIRITAIGESAVLARRKGAIECVWYDEDVARVAKHLADDEAMALLRKTVLDELARESQDLGLGY